MSQKSIHSWCHSVFVLYLSALLLSGPVHAAESRAATASASDELSITARIIGGRASVSGDWPSVVALLSTRSSANAEDRLFCSGTLIDVQWVLTAAHCLYTFNGQELAPEDISVLVGVTDLRDALSSDEFGIARTVIHDGYVNADLSSDDDIALLQLAAPVSVKQVAVLGEASGPIDGLTAYIVGWGASSYDDQGRFVYLPEQQEAEVPIVSLDVCNAPQSYDGLIGESQLCAGFRDGGVDACAGDSGGPLIIGIDKQQVQAGVVSFGQGCAEADFYGIYTRVSSYQAWIAEHVDADFQPAGDTPPPPIDPPVAEVDTPASPVTLPPTAGTAAGSGGGSPDRGLLLCLLGVGLQRWRRIAR